MYFDIHSHILPNMDDGAKDTKEAIDCLRLMEAEGITHVMATPHFDPYGMDLEDFLEARKSAYSVLCDSMGELPKVYLGSEILYFKRMGASRELDKLSLNNSKYILLELSDCHIDKFLFEDFELFKENGFVPIIAHIERYHRNRGFKKLIMKIKELGYPVQINSSSLLKIGYKRVIKKLFKMDLCCVLATDTHSVDKRPPILSDSFAELKKRFGAERVNEILENNKTLYNEIIGDSIDE